MKTAAGIAETQRKWYSHGKRGRRVVVRAKPGPRQLERLFNRHFGKTPQRYYLELRLE